MTSSKPLISQESRCCKPLIVHRIPEHSIRSKVELDQGCENVVMYLCGMV